MSPAAREPKKAAAAKPPLRRGLVLGAGGVLGAAWTIGALTALEESESWDARTAEVLVGTSAGSVLASFLGCNVAVSTLVDHQRGIPTPGSELLDYDYERHRALPPPPRVRMGSPALLMRTARRPWRVTPMAAMSSVLPQGRGSLAPVGELVEQVAPRGTWAPHPQTWVVAMDYDSGQRTVLGRDGSPECDLVDAVMASCSIPGWYAPVEIGGRRYVDGGACSPTSLDLVAPLGLDEVVVLSPMTSLELDRPTGAAARAERLFRRVVTRRLMAEVEKVRRTGTRVVVLSPGPEDLAVIGANLMNHRRRDVVLDTSLRTSELSLRRQRAAWQASA